MSVLLKRAGLAFGVCALWASSPAQAKEVFGPPRLQLSTGFDYARGDFGSTENTEIISVPLAARLSFGNFALRASVPILSIDGPADFVALFDDGAVADDNSGGRGRGRGGDRNEDDSGDTPDDSDGPGDPPPVDPPAEALRSRETGFGDLNLSLSYLVPDIASTPAYFEATGRVRLPTGDAERGLGIDTVDYSALGEVGLATRMGGLYAQGGRRFLSSTDTIARQDGWQLNGGGWWNVHERVTLTTFIDWRESTLAGGADPAEVGAGATFRINKQFRVGVNASAGLTNASPDFATGLSLIWRMANRRVEKN